MTKIREAFQIIQIIPALVAVESLPPKVMAVLDKIHAHIFANAHHRRRRVHFGAFIPRRGNVVIGRISDITFYGWIIDIDSAAQAFLPIDESPRYINRDEMDQYLAIGDAVAAKIWSVKSKGIDLTLKGKGLGKLEGGFIFRVIPSRVPRIIGREGSMVNLIKEKTNCNITVGQNGWIWIKGDSLDAEIRARKAIEFVVEKVYIEGLTDKMEEWFEKN